MNILLWDLKITTAKCLQRGGICCLEHAHYIPRAHLFMIPSMSLGGTLVTEMQRIWMNKWYDCSESKLQKWLNWWDTLWQLGCKKDYVAL